jgi:ATP-grasp domain-containing protein/L-aminoacid ligase-like protein
VDIEEADTVTAAEVEQPPMLLVGYSAPWAAALGTILPPNSLVFIDDPDTVRKRDFRAKIADQPVVRELIELDTLPEDAADRFFHAHRDQVFSAIVPMAEYGVPFAARLAERYRLPGAGYGAARTMRDKQLLRAVTGAAGIPNPPSVPVDGPAAVRDFMARVGGTVVLKPANRQASVGTQIIDDPADVDAAWDACTSENESEYMSGDGLPLRMLAERFLRGHEYSVEMLVIDGVPRFGAVTRKFLFDGPRPVEQGHLHPADIPAELTARLVADTARVMDAVGVRTAFVHCEWIVEDGVPYVVECAGRMGGDNIIELVILAWDYFVVGDYLAAMRGETVTAEPPSAAPRFAAAWLVHLTPGEIEAVEGADEVQAMEGISTVSLPPIGTQTHELRSSWDRQVTITAIGATAEQALERVHTAVGTVKVTVRPPV